MARRIYVERNSRTEDGCALIVIAFAVFYGKELLILGTAIAITWLFLKYLKNREQNRILRHVNDVGLAMEADHQNMLALQGDPAGIYGRYDAYTLPMTTQINLDDYNDGLREWR